MANGTTKWFNETRASASAPPVTGQDAFSSPIRSPSAPTANHPRPGPRPYVAESGDKGPRAANVQAA